MLNENTKVVLDVELKDAQIILNALVELPWRISNDLIGKLKNQITSQLETERSNVTQLNTGD